MIHRKGFAGALSKAVEVARHSLSLEALTSWAGSRGQSQPYDGSGQGAAATNRPAPSVDGPAFQTSDFPPPGIPFAPEYNRVAPRTFDFPASSNLNRLPRAGEENSFGILHQLAKHNDVVQYCIRAKTDLLTAHSPNWLPRDPAMRDSPEVRAAILSADRFWERPNRMDGLGFDGWLTQVLYDIFVTDALTIYPQRTVSGDVHSFVQVDGQSIKVLIDNFGRVPRAPAPAYQQVIHGLIRGQYTQEEMIYRPTNPQVDSPYGRSVVEMCLLHVVTGIRRWSFNLSYYSEGSIPQMFVQVPDVEPEAVKNWLQLMNETLGGDDAARWRIFPMPKDANIKEVRQPVWTREQDEWIARVICSLFSVSPTPFVAMNNRATAEVEAGQQIDLGLKPLKRTVATLMTELEELRSGTSLLRCEWPEDRTEMSEERANVLKVFLDEGIMTREEVREQMLGLDPNGGISDLPLGPLPVTQQTAFGADLATESVGADPVEQVIPFNELTLAIERLKALGDADMVNAIRGAMAARLGIAPPPPLEIASDVQDEVAVATATSDPTEVKVPEVTAGKSLSGAIADLNSWRKVAKKYGHDHSRTAGFSSTELSPTQMTVIKRRLSECSSSEQADSVLKAEVARRKSRGALYEKREVAMERAFAAYLKSSTARIAAEIALKD